MADSRPLFTIGTFAVIFNEDGRVLLSHRRDMDAWNLPGGGLEPGELPDEGVRREVCEETGLEVVVERLVGVYGKRGRNELVFAFVCRVVGGELMQTYEADENCYYPLDQLPPNTLIKHAERIWDALREDCRPVFRLQAGRPSAGISGTG
jgi:ADP-ribose pyrophosphatase YjhB (NUDIX family)